MKKEVLLLGNKKLYEKSIEIKKEELETLKPVIEDLHDTLIQYRQVYGAGRAIAAPQIDIQKRLIYMNTGEAVVFINPRLEFVENEKMEVLDDCMSFPGLYVKVLRYKKCIIHYRDINWNVCRMELEGSLAELIQHEYDHLDGILATMKAIDNQSFYIKKQK